MSKFIKHIVGEFDHETMSQSCIICGETICDYSNACWPIGQPPPSGWAAGALYIHGKNPTSYFQDTNGVNDFIEPGDVIINCNGTPSHKRE